MNKPRKEILTDRDGNRLYNEREAGKYMGGLSSHTLRAWRSKGTKRKGPKFLRVGGSIRYTESALDDFINENDKEKSPEELPMQNLAETEEDETMTNQTGPGQIDKTESEKIAEYVEGEKQKIRAGLPPYDKPDQCRFGDELGEKMDKTHHWYWTEADQKDWDDMIDKLVEDFKANHPHTVKPTKPDWKWQLEEDWVAAIAMDLDGIWYRYATVPKALKNDDSWWSKSGGIFYVKMHTTTYPKYDCPWQDSLMVRP